MSGERPTLGGAQRLVLDSIIASVRYRGFPPSVREIMRAAGLSSTSSVAFHLRALELKGYIERVHGLPRAIRIVE